MVFQPVASKQLCTPAGHFLTHMSSSYSCSSTVPQSNHTDKKENQFFPIYKEIQSGAVAKSYMRKDFPINEEMGKYFPIYKEAVSNI
jgi:hypothetical protein